MFLLNRFLQNPSRTRQLLYGQLPYHRYLLHRPVNFQHYCRNPGITHRACLASDTDRRGMGHELTAASVMIRRSPFSITPLHARQRALLDGARLIENLLSLAFMTPPPRGHLFSPRSDI